MGNMTENFVACKEQLLKNTHHLDLTWQLQPPQKYPKRMSTDWLYILAQPHVFLALHRIYLMLSVRQSLKHIIYPLDRYCFFKALTYTSPEYVKCVILCQDPYPSEQAMGLCLSAEKIMPSLRRFFKVIYASYGFDYKQSLKPPTGDLEYLAQQGVLLLNSALTVEEESTEKMDHVRAWSPIIDAILTAVYQANPYCAFLAMGDPAKEALSTIESTLEGNPRPRDASMKATLCHG
jgi:uracil-DNA glycosylase